MRYLNASARSIVTEAGNKRRCRVASRSRSYSCSCGTMHGLHSLSPYDLPRESVARDSRKRRRPVTIVKFAKCTVVSRFHCRDMGSLEKLRALVFFFLPIALRNGREYREISTMIDGGLETCILITIVTSPVFGRRLRLFNLISFLTKSPTRKKFSINYSKF